MPNISRIPAAVLWLAVLGALILLAMRLVGFGTAKAGAAVGG